MIIRPTTLDDEAAITALFEQSYPTLLARYYEPALLARALPIITKAQANLLQSGTFYIAGTASADCVACGGWTVARPGAASTGPEAESDLGHIRHFATHPDWTRRGFAKAIMARCLSDAAVAGIQHLECLSTIAAVDFYRSAGFAVIEPIDVALPGLKFPAIVMRRQLNNRPREETQCPKVMSSSG
jgi:GNAT superfamily N-acetyltransferase